MSDVSRETPAPPDELALVVPEDRVHLALRYVALLAGPGVEWGIIGPREAPRLWDRHVLNCTALTGVVPMGATVADLGSGAGLPGLPLAIARPDLRVTLVEPLLRRTRFLDEVVEELGMTGQVRVWRGRAEELHGRSAFDVVTSRALAPLDRLLRWSMPLVSFGGELVAMKGRGAEQEVADAADTLRRLHCATPRIEEVTAPGGSSTARVVRVAPAARARVS